MMYGQYYGKYERGEWLPELLHCTCCGKEAAEFLISEMTNEIVGCTECTTTSPSRDEQYMEDAAEGTFLRCPRCGELCDTLYAEKKNTAWVDGCENCMGWADRHEMEEFL